MDQTAALVKELASFAGLPVGTATSEGLYLGNRCIARQPDWNGTQRLLVNRNVGLAVFSTSPRTILEDGLPYDRCAVGVVLSLAGAALDPHHDILSDDQWRTVLRTQVDVVLPSGVAVLNADDPAVLDLAGLCDGSVTLISMAPRSEAVLAHLNAGGRAVVLQDGMACLCAGADELHRVALPAAAQPQSNTYTLAATAAAWALGIAPEMFAAALAEAAQLP
jgi:cyanophycin synthetase